uniref:Uncharacterized protein n=1 Tax=Grammatophora oceanica TaxID=210454 RepID=A0A7S1YGE2_9STRA
MPKMQPKKLKRHGGAFRVMAGISLAGILFVAALSRQRRPMKLRDDLNMALMELQDHYCAPVAQGDLGLNDSMQGDSVTAMEAPFWAIQSLKALTFDCLCPGRVKTTIRWQKVEPELRAAFWKRRKSQLYNLMINDEEGSVVLERKRVVSARVQKDKIVFTYHEGAEELAVAPWAA